MGDDTMAAAGPTRYRSTWGRAALGPRQLPLWGGVGGSLRLLESLPIIPVIVKDSAAQIAPANTAIGR